MAQPRITDSLILSIRLVVGPPLSPLIFSILAVPFCEFILPATKIRDLWLFAWFYQFLHVICYLLKTKSKQGKSLMNSLYGRTPSNHVADTQYDKFLVIDRCNQCYTVSSCFVNIHDIY